MCKLGHRRSEAAVAPPSQAGRGHLEHKRVIEEKKRTTPLEVLGHDKVEKDYHWSIVGTVRNNTDFTQEYVTIEAEILNDDREILSVNKDIVTALGAGKVWKFEIVVGEEEATNYRLRGVDTL